MNYSKRISALKCTLNMSRAGARNFVILIALAVPYAVSQAAQPTKGEAALQIQWLTVFDHSSLLIWPPNLTPGTLNLTVLEKLKVHLKLARNDIEFSAFPTFEKEVEGLRTVTETGERAYQALDHRKAAAALSKALDGYYALGWHLHKPDEIAQVQVLLGKTRIEQGKEGEAERLFRLAISLQPTLQIDWDFEHPNTVRIFKKARRSFLSRSPEMPGAVSRVYRNERTVQIHGRLIEGRIELMIHSSSGTRLEVERIDGNLDKAVSRLSTRILDCLHLAPSFAETTSAPSVITSLGLGLSSYVRSPVGPFVIYDTTMDYQYRLSRNLEWWTNLRLSNSGRDESEHIRDTITSLSISFAPRPRFHFGSTSLSVYFAPWVERRAQYKTTTNPACKFFSPRSAPPSRLCDFQQEVKSFPADWAIGIGVGTQVQVRLGRKVSLLWATSMRSKLLEDVSTSMQYLVGSHLSLGYEF
jgi:hypothetical protein